MNTKQMLELAALAAGYDVKPHPNRNRVSWLYFLLNGKNWNPLEDDGDCARLETKCEMLVSVDKDCARAGSYINGYGIECREQYAIHDGDRNKARRSYDQAAA